MVRLEELNVEQIEVAEGLREPKPCLRVHSKTADEEGVSPTVQILEYDAFIYLILETIVLSKVSGG